MMERAMGHADEKRGDERYACRSRLEWGYFNRRGSHRARMVNFSSGGVCFETTQPVTAGATVLLRVEDFRRECRAECRHGAGCPWVRATTLGEVKWCEDVSEAGHPRFGVGLKYHVAE